jgi:endonuclease III related protein
MMTTRQRLLRIFNILLTNFGRRNWWPGETKLEIIVGAVLTQNTAWKNVEKAIGNMKREGVLDIKTIHEISVEKLGEIIRPAGFFNIKSGRLKALIGVLHDSFKEDIENLSPVATDELRTLFLSIDGIGYETADSILLYALHRPVFVVDAYTKRFLGNHDLYNGNSGYHDIQGFFMEHLPPDTYLFNEFHALIVYLCQHYCKKVPLCDTCPLKDEFVEGLV